MGKIIFIFFLCYNAVITEKYIVIRIPDNNSVNMIPDLGFSAVTSPPMKEGLDEGENEGTNEGENEGLDEGENKGLSGVVKKKNKIGTIESWGPYFRVSFEMIIKSFSGAKWTNILSFKGNGATSNCCKHGDRAPALYLENKEKYLVFSHSVSGNGRYSYKFRGGLQLNKWYKITIEQRLINEKVNCKRIVALVSK